LTIRRADGRTLEETVLGEAWSRPIDLSGQFIPPWRAAVERQLPIAALVLIFALALGARLTGRGTRGSGPWGTRVLPGVRRCQPNAPRATESARTSLA